ncbi:hypothetical protein [Kutzneria sp. 744]|uniref:hypothetical protein n=1 Tax=Kutzneria sp. (strain 744) TaxID=345341 RepID=UPI0003EED70D|nr:hypothetical protein [Kutzneria sp. 744]EWM19161.1 hypothetical protein KUTG_09465 [Kutzneria sp. 744]
MDETAYWLARLRATRTAPEFAVPDAAELVRVAERAGRALAIAEDGDQVPVLVLGAAADFLPEDGDGFTRPVATGPVRLVMAVCLRCCWLDPDLPIYPGRPTTVGEIQAVLAALGESYDAPRLGRPLMALRVTGYLRRDGDLIRLGPKVALWSTSELTALRQLHELLPEPDGRFR